MTASPALDRVQRKKRKDKMEFTPEYRQAEKLAKDMRDFSQSLTKDAVTIYTNLITEPPSKTSPVDLEDLEYIDADVDSRKNSDSDEFGFGSKRIQRWRTMSKKFRCPRLKAELVDDDGERSVCLLGSWTALGSTGELHSPTSHQVALTAPSSPSAPAAMAMQTLAAQSAAFDYFGSSPECSQISKTPCPPPGPRYKPITEGILRVCSLQHAKTVFDKIITNKFLKKWESHVVCITDVGICAKNPFGLLERPITFGMMQEIGKMAKVHTAHKYCIRIIYCSGSLLLQASNLYVRDQWFYTILWKRNMAKYRNIMGRSDRKEVILKELKNMVDFVMSSPLQDDPMLEEPLDLITNLLVEEKGENKEDCIRWQEALIKCAAPLLAERTLSSKLCEALAMVCRQRPRIQPLPVALTAPIRRILTRNVDFGRAPHARQFVKDYIAALNCHNPPDCFIRRFVAVCHGPKGSSCPHPRTLPNLVSVSLSALNDQFRDGADDQEISSCFADIFIYVSEYDDWRPGLAALLQPVPFIPEVLNNSQVANRLGIVLRTMAQDERCCVHSCLVAARQGRDSWMHVAAPGRRELNLPQADLSKLWGDMLKILLSCCFKRKSFLEEYLEQLPAFLLVASNGHTAALEALCLMLEWKLPTPDQINLEIIPTLNATELGCKYYEDLLERRKHLKHLLSEGGPKILALPVKATDKDLEEMLAAGKFGNLECLSLAFTCVTSACAYQLIKLPTLRYLNLWATQFGDAGVQLISEHLTKLQVLNLCETPISDKGIEALASLSNLKRLNLNSTKLSAEAFAGLKKRLPNLTEFDIRYTEAW